jgi:dipeptidyl aminopeptidase/acylaminoacyl peptidase
MKETRLSVASYGSWKSPISSELIVSETIGLGQIALDGDDVYWLEMRPGEGGRQVVVRQPRRGEATDVTPAAYNVRTRVHEMGGGAFVVDEGTIFFSNFSDQRLYCQGQDGAAAPITPEGDLRYADAVVDRRRRRIICVCEDHTDKQREAVNTLVTLELSGETKPKPLVFGNDFYSSPRLSPDGTQLAWLTWNHPGRPWDQTELWIATLDENGAVVRAERVAGGADESVFQPEWSPDGVLYFVSDRTGWWNLYRRLGEQLEPVVQMDAEFGLPQWVFGLSTYAFDSEHRIVCAYSQEGTWRLGTINTQTGELQAIETPYTEIEAVRADSGRVVFLGASPTEFSSVVELELASKQLTVLRRASRIRPDASYVSLPEAVEFPTGQGLTAHAFFYAPKNPDYVAPANELPPLLVTSHGGPTSATSSQLNLTIQYWTSRGIAVVDVNYGGSSGYGRAYRQRLDGNWGVVDVDDCVNAARYLVGRGDVDGARLAIRGRSAGGYTTLCALTFRDVFKAGASYYGISDLEVLAKDTHKFESRYLDRLIGPHPDNVETYAQRSPIHFVDRLSCPVIFFQGLEDRIVPPNQAELMVNVLRAKGLPVAYVSFPGEQHGFRRAESIKRAMDAELYFYSQVLGFGLAEFLEPVEIENL